MIPDANPPVTTAHLNGTGSTGVGCEKIPPFRVGGVRGRNVHGYDLPGAGISGTRTLLWRKCAGVGSTGVLVLAHGQFVPVGAIPAIRRSLLRCRIRFRNRDLFDTAFHPGAGVLRAQKRVPLVDHLERDEAWRTLASMSPAQLTPAGVALLEEGQRTDFVCLLDHGLVRLACWQKDREVTVQWRRGPSILGLSALRHDSIAPVSAYAVSPCRVRFAAASKVRPILQNDNRLLWRLFLLQGEEIQHLSRRVARAASMTARERLVSALLDLADSFGRSCGSGSLRVVLPITWDHLAQSLQITPQWQSRLLRELEADGVISREGRRRLVISDPARLRRESETAFSVP